MDTKMNQRLQQFLDAENISPSVFADNMEITRASVSHLLSGRNRPGFDFLERMASRYPDLSLEWLITGRGRMYKEPEEKAPEASQMPILPPPRKVSRILVFYDDNTFEEF